MQRCAIKKTGSRGLERCGTSQVDGLVRGLLKGLVPNSKGSSNMNHKLTRTLVLASALAVGSTAFAGQQPVDAASGGSSVAIPGLVDNIAVPAESNALAARAKRDHRKGGVKAKVRRKIKDRYKKEKKKARSKIKNRVNKEKKKVKDRYKKEKSKIKKKLKDKIKSWW